MSATDAGSDSTTASLEELARRLGVDLSLLAGMVEIINREDLPTDQLDVALRNVVEMHALLAERVRASSSQDQEIQRLRERAAVALEGADYTQADGLLAEAEARDLEVLEATEERLRHRRLAAARTRAERGELARLRLDYFASAHHYAAAAAMVPRDDQETRWNYLVREAQALHAQGKEFGDNTALQRAIAVLHVALDLVPRKAQPTAWATIATTWASYFERWGSVRAGRSG